MLNRLEQAYLDLFFQLQQQQWENYAHDAGHDLSQTNQAISALLNDPQLENPFQGRKGAVWEAIVTRGKVDNHPAVAALRNKLDDWDNYTPTPLPDDRQAARLALARNMRSDVLQLLELRQQIAQQAGFTSYVDLVLAGEDLSRPTVVSLIEQYLNTHLAQAQALVDKYQISWTTWFSDLDRLGNLPLEHDQNQLVSRLLQQLGLAHCQTGLTIITKPDGFGYTGVLQPGRDVRILLNNNTSLRGLLTLGHELGHALAHLNNRNAGLFLTWTTCYDESMAVTMEQIAARLWLTPKQRQVAHELWLLEGVRCALSFLFELALWEEPAAAESNYLKYYGQLGLDLGDPAIWALDSFRSIDPVYIHNYVLGDIFAQRTLAHLEHLYGSDYKAWGTWLVENFYVPGREQDWPSLLTKV